MALFDGIANGMQKNPSVSPEIQQAEKNCNMAESAVNAAMLALGKKYYEENKENSASEYAEQITEVTECIKKESLWKQYRLTLEGKMKCEKCGAIITSDSAFCNKCGTSIKPLDFSSLGINSPDTSNTINSCPSCGAPLVSDAMFCEKCGHRLRS